MSVRASILSNCECRDKHNPAEWRPEGLDTVLPVVLIKDSLTWMHSMCRHKYKLRGECSPVLPCAATVAVVKHELRYI